MDRVTLRTAAVCLMVVIVAAISMDFNFLHHHYIRATLSLIVALIGLSVLLAAQQKSS